MEVPSRIISGGQTGVDRAALDAAIEAGIPISGWVPLGRIAEDGKVPDRYAVLKECSSRQYPARTRLNVHDTNGVLILAAGAVSGGTLLTLNEARRWRKLESVVDLKRDADTVIANGRLVRQWLAGPMAGKVLMVAGPRESKCPGIYDLALAFLREVLKP